MIIPCRVGSVGSVSASRPGHTKDHHKTGTNCLPTYARMRYGWSLAVQLNCLKGRVVCGTVYGEMHLKDLLGSFARFFFLERTGIYGDILMKLCHHQGHFMEMHNIK